MLFVHFNLKIRIHTMLQALLSVILLLRETAVSAMLHKTLARTAQTNQISGPEMGKLNWVS